MIQERSSANTPTVTYTRGNDLSGSLEGAGGIGGMLARSHGYSGSTGAWSTHNYYHADAGGNITCLINSGQSITASYRYDPFGRTLFQSGTMANANVYRFSSKEVHGFTGMYYYGFRFYDPGLQRWINRDPLGELGGLNLYGFVGNSPLVYVDPYGLAWYDWDWIDTVGNWGAGVGDSLSFGLTDWARDQFGLNDVIDPCSGAYNVGEWTGTAAGVALGGVGGLGRTAGREFSHWIPDRALKQTGSNFLRNTFGRSPFNGNYVSPARHFKHDPFRYPKGNAGFGKKFNPAVQQLDRIPTAYAGSAYAGQGASNATDGGNGCD